MVGKIYWQYKKKEEVWIIKFIGNIKISIYILDLCIIKG